VFAFISVALIFCLAIYIAYLPSCVYEKKFLKKTPKAQISEVRFRKYS